MNKLSLIVFGLLVAAPVGASTYSIDLDGQVNGSKPIKGSVVVNEGEAGAISFEDTTINFVPTQAGNGAIKIQAEVLKKTHGKSVVVSKPSVVTLPNESAEIFQRQNDGSAGFRLKLTPKVL